MFYRGSSRVRRGAKAATVVGLALLMVACSVVRAEELRSPRALAAGAATVCEIDSGGAVYCWGAGDHGQIGDGGREHRFEATAVTLPHAAVEVAVGTTHVCAVLDDGGVWCWGASDFGQVGQGVGQPAFEPAQVPGLADARGVATSNTATCAVLGDGTVRCWALLWAWFVS